MTARLHSLPCLFGKGSCTFPFLNYENKKASIRQNVRASHATPVDTVLGKEERVPSEQYARKAIKILRGLQRPQPRRIQLPDKPLTHGCIIR